MEFKDMLNKMNKEEYYDPLAKFDGDNKEYFLEYNSKLDYLYASLDVYNNVTYHDCVKYDAENFKDEEVEEVLARLKKVLDERYEVYKKCGIWIID